MVKTVKTVITVITVKAESERHSAIKIEKEFCNRYPSPSCMPTLSLDRTPAPLPNPAAHIASRSKLTSVVTQLPLTSSVALIPLSNNGVHHKEFSSRITLTTYSKPDETKDAENDNSDIKFKNSTPPSQNATARTLVGDGAALPTDKDRIPIDMQHGQQLPQKTTPSTQPKQGHKPTQPQQMVRDRDETQRRDEVIDHKKLLQTKTPPEKQRKSDQQCNFPTIIPTTTRPHNPPLQQQQGYTNQQQQQQPQNAIKQDNNLPSEQRQGNFPPNHLIKKLPPQIQQRHHTNGNQSGQGPNTTTGTTSTATLNVTHQQHIFTQPQPTPFFDRLVSEEVQEFKSYARIIESQSRRLNELESLHHDLEARLEFATAQRFEMEATLERQELEWTRKFINLEKECEEWKKLVQTEQTKNERLLELVYRKDREIQRMIQRKYDPSQHDHSPTGPTIPTGQSHNRQQGILHSSQSVHSNSQPMGRISSNNIMEVNKSPHEILAAHGSTESVRARNVLSALNDFFGL